MPDFLWSARLRDRMQFLSFDKRQRPVLQFQIHHSPIKDVVVKDADRLARFEARAHQTRFMQHATLGERIVLRLQSRKRTHVVPVTSSQRQTDCGDAPNFLAANIQGHK